MSQDAKIFSVELSYKYSDLDKEHQFGLVINYPDGNYDFNKNYANWVWYYLGVEYGAKRKFNLYPSELYNGKIIKRYKYCNDAVRQAQYIIEAIKKQINKKNNRMTNQSNLQTAEEIKMIIK